MMLFNSYTFAYFFIFVFFLYWALPHRAQNVLLLAASYVFYGCWDARFLSLLAISTVMDFLCGLAVNRFEQPARRKACVAASMALNLGFLGYFKYCNFFAESLKVLLARLGLEVPLGQLQVVLPIGISFYTFQSMSYVIDVYRRDIRPTRSLVEFAAFVAFFPHLVAGPIMRPTTLLPQIERPRRFALRQFYEGSYLIFWGLTKKVVIADNLARVVNDLFARSDSIHGGEALLAIYAFAFQIYCDFSGYTDAARGVAKCLGFELALNFNLPYFAASPKEFWSRWHISLSTWLRDYLYIPLGGSRGDRAIKTGNLMLAAGVAGLGLGLGMLAFERPPLIGAARRIPALPWLMGLAWIVACGLLLRLRSPRLLTYRNLLLTMVIGGLWHGAAWTFVLWGFYHGGLLVAHRLLEPRLGRYQPADPVERACWKGIRIFVTFHLICVGWLLFRAQSLGQVADVLGAIVGHPALPAASVLVPFLACVVPLGLLQCAQYLARDLDVLARTPWYVRSIVYTAIFYGFVLGGEFGGGQFIYFQF
jgi:D-alanyl-lipoteichoic acid acyltransferase DltB (MBOAT superfamily)